MKDDRKEDERVKRKIGSFMMNIYLEGVIVEVLIKD